VRKNLHATDAVQLAFQRDRDRRVRESAVSQTRARFEALTLREQEVFSLVTTGLMNKQVAERNGLTQAWRATFLMAHSYRNCAVNAFPI
jgi:FixJ family two-component response regulator